MLEQGAVLAWGNNEYGQLGVTSKECQLPVPMVLEGQKVMDGPVICIAAGGPFTAFLTSELLTRQTQGRGLNCVAMMQVRGVSISQAMILQDIHRPMDR